MPIESDFKKINKLSMGICSWRVILKLINSLGICPWRCTLYYTLCTLCILGRSQDRLHMVGGVRSLIELFNSLLSNKTEEYISLIIFIVQALFAVATNNGKLKIFILLLYMCVYVYYIVFI